MGHHNLIKALVKKLEPVRPRLSPSALSIRLLPLFALLTILAVFYHGVRVDLVEKVTAQSFLCMLASSLGIVVLGLLTSLTLSSPGLKPRFFTSAMALIPVPFLIYASRNFWYEEIFSERIDFFGVKCAELTLGVSLTCLMVLFFFIRRRFSTRPIVTSLFASFTALAVGWLAISLTCSFDHSLHILIYHLLLPAVVISFSSLVIAKFAIKF